MSLSLGEARQFVAGTLRHPLARRHPIATLARIARWQVESRLRTGTHDKAWIGGSRLLVKRGMTGATGNIYYGLHEFADMAFLLHFLRPEDLFLDIGANVGTYTVLAGKVVGARVLAFEPHPTTADWLEANIRHNEIEDRATVHRVALSDHDGAGALTEGLDTMNRVVAVGEGREVKLQTLDSLIAGQSPAMLKIDVEGHEPEVLAGAAATLANPSLLAIEIETVTPDILALLQAQGFVERFYDPFARALSEAPVATACSNRLFLRDSAVIEERIRTAPRFAAAGSIL
jgi:FkbM family methyltransferase